ncbi:MAG: hypothetical protein LBP73_06990 [Clostridiales Family XIII bacterium]|nr:hypothetical protein [Clostridiales Family XIII bacterium]
MPDERKTIERMLAGNHSLGEIAKTLGRNMRAIRAIQEEAQRRTRMRSRASTASFRRCC